MKPTKNRVFCPECRRTKILFETEAKAERFIEFNKSEMQDYHPVRTYYCVACCGWHTTSSEEYKPGHMDSERIIDAYRKDVQYKIEHDLRRLEDHRSIIDIHNFLQRCVKGKRPIALTHEQLMRIKATYISIIRYKGDTRSSRSVRSMLTQLGVQFTDEESLAWSTTPPSTP